MGPKKSLATTMAIARRGGMKQGVIRKSDKLDSPLSSLTKRGYITPRKLRLE
jgi:hypothetical protein